VEAARELVGKLWRGDGDEFGMMAFDLKDEFIQIITGGESDDVELAGEGFDDGKSLAADGAGGAEDGDGEHGGIGDRFCHQFQG